MSDAIGTRVVRLTPRGRGALATLLVQGPLAMSLVSRYFTPANGRDVSEQPMRRILFGHWGFESREEVVVARIDDERIEVSCHGGEAAPRRVINDLMAAGAQEIDWRHWIKIDAADSIEAEATLALSMARTQRAALVLSDQLQGALRRAIESIKSALAANDAETAGRRLQDLLAWSALGLRLTGAWRVVVAGPPNVGKSSLVNAIAGFERAIVYDQPGTTRDVIAASIALGGWPIDLIDTAGLHLTDDAIEAAGVQRAREQFASADLVLLVSDPTSASLSDIDFEIGSQSIRINVRNKCDLAPLSQRTSSDASASLTRWTSALTGDGIAELIQAIVARLVPTEPPPGTAVPFTVEQVAAIGRALEATRRGQLQLAAQELARI